MNARSKIINECSEGKEREYADRHEWILERAQDVVKALQEAKEMDVKSSLIRLIRLSQELEWTLSLVMPIVSYENPLLEMIRKEMISKATSGNWPSPRDE